VSGQGFQAYELAINWLADAPDSEILATSVKEVIAEAQTKEAKIAACRDGVRTLALWRIETDPAGAAAIHREAADIVTNGPMHPDPLWVLKSHAVEQAFKECRWPSSFRLESVGDDEASAPRLGD